MPSSPQGQPHRPSSAPASTSRTPLSVASGSQERSYDPRIRGRSCSTPNPPAGVGSPPAAPCVRPSPPRAPLREGAADRKPSRLPSSAQASRTENRKGAVRVRREQTPSSLDGRLRATGGPPGHPPAGAGQAACPYVQVDRCLGIPGHRCVSTCGQCPRRALVAFRRGPRQKAGSSTGASLRKAGWTASPSPVPPPRALMVHRRSQKSSGEPTPSHHEISHFAHASGRTRFLLPRGCSTPASSPTGLETTLGCLLLVPSAVHRARANQLGDTHTFVTQRHSLSLTDAPSPARWDLQTTGQRPNRGPAAAPHLSTSKQSRRRTNYSITDPPHPPGRAGWDRPCGPSGKLSPCRRNRVTSEDRTQRSSWAPAGWSPLSDRRLEPGTQTEALCEFPAVP